MIEGKLCTYENLVSFDEILQERKKKFSMTTKNDSFNAAYDKIH